MRNLPSLDTRDPNFVRIKYVRYADDWLIGVIGSHELAEEIKNRVGEFLKDKLALTLSQDKTRITNARTEEAEFLGYRIRRGRGKGLSKSHGIHERIREAVQETVNRNGSGAKGSDGQADQTACLQRVSVTARGFPNTRRVGQYSTRIR